MKSDRVFVIAEAGVNHNGSLDAAIGLVDAAADAGADVRERHGADRAEHKRAF